MTRDAEDAKWSEDDLHMAIVAMKFDNDAAIEVLVALIDDDKPTVGALVSGLVYNDDRVSNLISTFAHLAVEPALKLVNGDTELTKPDHLYRETEVI